MMMNPPGMTVIMTSTVGDNSAFVVAQPRSAPAKSGVSEGGKSVGAGSGPGCASLQHGERHMRILL